MTSARWHALASREPREVDVPIDRAEGMIRLLEESLGRGCLTRDAWALVLTWQQADAGADGGQGRARL